jgi:CheY-like chemotaxis protein
VRRDVHKNTTPLIVVSAAKTTENVTQAMQAGADIFLGKPVSAKELAHVVTALINQHERGAASIHTKHLVGTAPLRSLTPESRRDAAVIFIAGHGDSPVVLNLRQPVTFGRQTNAPANTHIDLTRFQAVDLGVSRIHAQMSYKDGKFMIEDKGSVNGTFLNGQSLRQGEIMPVANGDEIRLGQLRMYVYFLADPDKEK